MGLTPTQCDSYINTDLACATRQQVLTHQGCCHTWSYARHGLLFGKKETSATAALSHCGNPSSRLQMQWWVLLMLKTVCMCVCMCARTTPPAWPAPTTMTSYASSEAYIGALLATDKCGPLVLLLVVLLLGTATVLACGGVLLAACFKSRSAHVHRFVDNRWLWAIPSAQQCVQHSSTTYKEEPTSMSPGPPAQSAMHHKFCCKPIPCNAVLRFISIQTFSQHTS